MNALFGAFDILGEEESNFKSEGSIYAKLCSLYLITERLVRRYVFSLSSLSGGSGSMFTKHKTAQD